MSRPITIERAAGILGVSKATLRRWDRAGRLRARRHPINGYRLYDVDEMRREAKRLAFVRGHEHRRSDRREGGA